MIDKRLVLRVTIKFMSLAVIGFFLFVFLNGLLVDENKQAAGITVDISDVKPGDYKVVDNGQRKILLLHRTPSQLSTISNLNEELYDADSARDLPSDFSVVYRSVKPELFVAFAYDPFFGCGVEIDIAVEQINSICSSVKYDFSGRVYKGSVSQSNLIVPDYYYANDVTVVVKP